MKTKSVLVIVAVAMFALVIGQAQADLIPVPNGDFQTMYKPDTGGTVTATVPDGCYWGIPNMNIKGDSGPATYSDGTTGNFVETPGWVIADKDNADCMQGSTWGGPDGSGDVAFLCFAGWGGPTTIESAEPLSVPFGLNYKLSAGIFSGGRPVVLELRVDGVLLTPETSDIPATSADWTEMSNTYRSIPDGDVKILVGTRDYTGGGWTGNRASIDNITFEVFGLMYPSPEHGETVLTDENLELSWTNLPNDGNDVYVDVWFGTEPNELNPNYDMTMIVDATNGDDGKNTNSVLVDASVADTYYWQVNSYLNGASKINDANMIEAGLWHFYAVDDIAPSVEIVTPDQMTWSGEGVPLDATVTDDAASALTIEWTADLPTGITASFDPVDEADTTVTLNKVGYSQALIVNAGFESPDLDDGASINAGATGIPGWTEGYYTGLGSTWDPYNGLAGAIDPAGDTAAQGENVAWCQIYGGYHDGLSQTLTETLQPETQYDLSVQVGTPSGQVPESYRIQLLAGDTVVEETGAAPAGDTWITASLTHTTGSAETEPDVGEPITIRLMALDGTHGSEVYFDDVVLTADPGFPTTGAVQTVTVTVTVGDEANPTADTASIEIDVYDDACHMARVAEGKSAITDFNGNCITGLEDLAVIAAAWLDSYAVTGPVDRP